MKLDGMDGLVMWAWRGYFRSGQIFVDFSSEKVQKKPWSFILVTSETSTFGCITLNPHTFIIVPNKTPPMVSGVSFKGLAQQ